MISDRVYNFCRGKATVSDELAKDPTVHPGEVFKHLFSGSTGSADKVDPTEDRTYTPEDLQRAFECGKWGETRPSDLFLKIYHDALCTLNDDAMEGVVSPPLMGSSGVLPLTIVSTVPDIVRHMANLIVRAEREVYLATNYWLFGDTTTLITDALKELSRRAGERGIKAVVKVIYDRGNVKQLFDNHQTVSESQYTAKAVQLPAPHEIPHIDMQVVNYHRPMLGTFHAKFMIVDRKIAILGSNNIQETDNVEMMCQFEGPIVDGFYDMALISWHNAMNPPLPSHNSPAATDTSGGSGTFKDPSFIALFNADGTLKVADLGTEKLDELTTSNHLYDDTIAGEAHRSKSVLTPRAGETQREAVTRHLNTTIQPNTKGDAPEFGPDDVMAPYIPHPPHAAFPIALVNRKPFGTPNNSDINVPQNAAWLSALRNCSESIFIQTPTLNASPLPPAILAACRRGIVVTAWICLGYNDAGELLPGQGGTNEMVAHAMYGALEPAHRANLRVHFYVAKDQTRPLNAKFKKRDCHIKLMIVDGRIGIQGSGNQDTQSWFHSQEANVLLEAPHVCAAWMAGLRRNQNTELYGALGEDGMWRDKDGKEAEGSIGVDPGRFSWARGIVGAVQRVRGAGGF